MNAMISTPLEEMDTVDLNKTLIAFCVSFNVRSVIFEDGVVLHELVFCKGRRRGRKARYIF